MRNPNTIRSKRTKRLLLISLSVMFIVFGLWFSSTNAYTFLKGYLLFKTGQVDAEDYKVKSDFKGTNEKKQEQQLLYPERPEQGELIGELIIPTLEAKLPIYHGTDEEELEKGIGHFSDSVLPGEKDNSILSGHRDTVFRKLGEVGKERPFLVVKTCAGEFTYKVKTSTYCETRMTEP